MSQVTYLKNERGETVAEATLHGFAGNRTIAVLGEVLVSEKERGKGFGKRIVRQAICCAEAEEKAILLATVLDRNLAMVHILEIFGWAKQYGFFSVASGLPCGLWLKSLNP
jgi:predicted GNAT family N-acyltransferase